MGRKLDLSALTDHEAEHVLQVVQRDMRLRKKEEERLSELRQELDDEGSRCLLLSRQGCFNQRCCIRCCSPFTFLLNPKRPCRDCRYNVCKACRVYNKRDGAWLCCACQKSRLLKTQSLEWFYTNVKKRFKRFGSAKVLKTLYRKHLAEHSALSELTEGSAYEESICNEGSISESDSTFYRQSEEHSMAETLTVALRVAEEAIDEAISKAEFHPACQKKQNEAHYLREHRAELVEELAKTIVQKIISRRKTLAEMRAEYNQEWPLHQNTGPHRPPSSSDQASSSLQHQAGLWRSYSAFSLSANDAPSLIQDSSLTLKKEGAASAMSAWKSVDRLDNAGVSSVLKSPDGNWIALQSAQLSRPSLLTKRKSLVYSALERESGAVSAYEGMGSDAEAQPELHGSWGAVLQEIHRKMTDCNLNLQDTRQPREEAFSDPEGNRKANRPLLAFFKRKLPAEIRRPSSSRRTSVIDVNFNAEQPGGAGPEPEVGRVRRSRRKRRSKKERVASSAAADLNRKDEQPDQTSDTTTPDTVTSGATTPEPLEHRSDASEQAANQTEEQLTQPPGGGSDCSTRGNDRDGEADDGRQRMGEREAGEEDDERLWKMEIDEDEDRTKEEEEDEEERALEPDDEDMKERLYRLVAQSRLTYFSSTDEELNKLAQGEGKWEDDHDEDMEDEEETTEGLTHRLCQLEKEVGASQFSSTEDELHRAAADEEELALKVCRLADQVDATQFSSTEDELEAAGRGGEEEEEVINEQTLWTLQTETTVQAAQLRDLASLVSASQFSSTEDELDRVGGSEGALEQGGGSESSNETEEGWEGEVERRESFCDLDVKMFDLRDETEEPKSESSKDVTDGEMKMDVEGEEMEPDTNESFESVQAAETKDERAGEEKLEDEAEGEQGAEDTINETRVEDGEQPKDGDGQREGRFEERRESRAPRETTADGYEDDDEFDRIISSMLMMTLDDMQVEPPTEEPAETETTGESGGRAESRPQAAVEQRLEHVGDEPGVAEEEDGGVAEEDGRPAEMKQRLEHVGDEPGGVAGSGREEEGTAEVMASGKTWGEEEAEGEAGSPAEEEQSCTTAPPEGFLSPQEVQNRYSAASLRSITTEVLKVLNATEDLLQGAEPGDETPPPSLPPHSDPRQLDQQFSRLEESVYVAAGSVYGLEAELGDLEECARGICSSTPCMELSYLEEQVASAAAKVQQSELQISDISARIAALKSAGLNVETQSRFKPRAVPVMPATLDSSRQLRRRLPAPPGKDDKNA
ncbi:rab effector MyRIP isoform X2 [Betta splendens]|uniref:Rab effector MyRIP isoform X2 n=1 Tax=Betta splendens TaxID=158456 RepID=A0A9W2XD80_BETSP|nr:rab effector MyRIP isoform X2 [Betta splendens]